MSRLTHSLAISAMIAALLAGGCAKNNPSPIEAADPQQEQRIEAAIHQVITAPTVAEQAAAVIASTEDRAGERLIQTAAAVRMAQEVVSRNIANLQTTAYKRVRPVFSADGIKVSLQNEVEQGSLENTGRSLDVGIEGDGFFRLKIGSGDLYTRNGNLFVNKDGALVVGIGDGYLLEPKIVIPPKAIDVTISQTGFIHFQIPGATAKSTAGQIKLHVFPRPEELTPIGGSLYRATEGAGDPVEATPRENGAGVVLQNYLEASNVDLLRERLRMARLEEWSRAIERAIASLERTAAAR